MAAFDWIGVQETDAPRASGFAPFIPQKRIYATVAVNTERKLSPALLMSVARLRLAMANNGCVFAGQIPTACP